jgi:aspartyl-tRNA synthetase
MEFGELNEFAQHKEFPVFNAAEPVVGIAVPCRNIPRKEIDALIDWETSASRSNGYAKCNEDGTFKSSVDKFYDQEDLEKLG